jgi:hypothetical protein
MAIADAEVLPAQPHQNYLRRSPRVVTWILGPVPETYL